ncbi:uncharacterized protein LOC117315902 isoform X2 [Pecten maximus]|uniref:uncharacterized protein LOC117315902 isoform X2 n=1 Tax=Pecten maximus TaxID=6579 RepID=UPI0014590E0E|nr:uncharacterized protein LOC117315902 isoform X2 [Pecten maximus]
MSAAILLSGNNYQKIALLHKFLNLGMISSTSHLRVQRTFTVPVIDFFKQTVMTDTLNKYKGKELVIAGDARNDSPGHSAMYCTYTFIEYETKDIVSSVIIDKRMTNLKSINMEMKGMLRAMQSLLDNGVAIKEVCTDAHAQIASMLTEARNKDLRPWVQDLVNHFWYCSRKSQGSEMALISRWRGVLHHVTDVHEWVIGDSAGSAQCEHEPLPATPDMETKWLEPGSDAHCSLAKVILDTRLLHNLKYYVNFRHTGELENFHEHILMYAAKRYSYSYPMYKARNQLAIIDYQHHKERNHATDKKGQPMYARKYSKRNKNWSVVPVKEKKTYSYIPDMMKEILQRLSVYEGPLPTRFPPEEGDPRLIKRTIAEVSPIPTKELVARKKSRFQ